MIDYQFVNEEEKLMMEETIEEEKRKFMDGIIDSLCRQMIQKVQNIEDLNLRLSHLERIVESKK